MKTEDIIKWLMRGGVTVEDITDSQLDALSKYWKVDIE